MLVFIKMRLLIALILLAFFNTISCHELYQNLMKQTLKEIRGAFDSHYNLLMAEKLGSFLDYEEYAKEWSDDTGEGAADTEKILGEFKAVLDELLQAQKETVDGITKSVLAEIEKFDNTSESLLLTIQDTMDSTLMVSLEQTLFSVISEHVAELKSVRCQMKDCERLVTAIFKALKVHMEWTELLYICSLVQEDLSVLRDTIYTSEARADLLSDTFADPPPDHKEIQLPELPEDDLPILGPAFEFGKTSVPTEQIIKYDSVGKLKRFKMPDSGAVPRISCTFMVKDVQESVENIAMLGHRVLWVQQKDNIEEKYARFHESVRLDSGYYVGILKMSPLDLENHPNLLDKHAANEDGHRIVNLKGQAEMKKRMFLPFHIASFNSYDAIVIDCTFGKGPPYLNNPSNLGFTYMAATAFYSSLRINQFILAGDVYSPFCVEILRTMSLYSKDKFNEA
jgi:hypothetical protein